MVVISVSFGGRQVGFPESGLGDDCSSDILFGYIPGVFIRLIWVFCDDYFWDLFYSTLRRPFILIFVWGV
jgi:hypothetical protein